MGICSALLIANSCGFSIPAMLLIPEDPVYQVNVCFSTYTVVLHLYSCHFLLFLNVKVWQINVKNFLSRFSCKVDVVMCIMDRLYVRNLVLFCVKYHSIWQRHTNALYFLRQCNVNKGPPHSNVPLTFKKMKLGQNFN